GDGLPGVGVGALRCPVALVLDFFVGNGAFHHQDEGIDFASLRLVEVLHEVVSDFVGQHWIMQMNLRKAGDGAEDNVLDARLLGVGHGYGIAIAAKSGCYPDDVHLFNWRWCIFASKRYRFDWHERLLSEAG